MASSHLQLSLLLVLCTHLCSRSAAEKFDVCEEKTGIVQKAKATQLGAKLMDKCFLPVASKYKFTAKMIQRGSDAYREAVYTCVANIASLLTVVLNPEWIEGKNVEDPKGLYHDGVSCARKHKIFTEDPAISLFGINGEHSKMLSAC